MAPLVSEAMLPRVGPLSVSHVLAGVVNLFSFAFARP